MTLENHKLAKEKSYFSNGEKTTGFFKINSYLFQRREPVLEILDSPVHDPVPPRDVNVVVELDQGHEVRQVDAYKRGEMKKKKNISTRTEKEADFKL